MKLFRSTFLIRPENFAKAARALFAFDLVRAISFDDEYADIIEDVFRIVGLAIRRSEEGVRPVYYTRPGFEKGIEFMERVFKAVSKSVEPGAYIEFWDGDTIIRYDFLYDTVERCTVPHIMYAQREAI